MTNVLVTGAGGQLGRCLKVTEPDNLVVHYLAHDELDISDAVAVEAFLRQHAITWLINTAAYTAVDNAEKDQENAFRANEAGPEMLAKCCGNAGTHLIHVSTDFVFSGDKALPYTENDVTEPANVYGKSKLAGELGVLREHPAGSTIIRTSWLYSEFGNNFVKTMLRLQQERDELGVVTDQTGKPTYARSLARLIWSVVEGGTESPGIYHWCDEGETNWFDFAMEIQKLGHQTKLLTSECKLHPLTTEQYPTPATRPRYSSLDTTKVVATFGLRPDPWQAELATMLTNLQASLETRDSSV